VEYLYDLVVLVLAGGAQELAVLFIFLPMKLQAA